MRLRVKILLIAVAVVVLPALVSRYIRLPFLGIDPEEAIPHHTALIVSFQKKMLEKMPPAGLQRIFQPEAVRQDLELFEKIFHGQIPLSSDQQLLATVQPTRTSGTDVLFLVDGFRKLELEQALRNIKGSRVKTSIFRNHPVFTVKTGNADFSFSKYRNLLLFGRHAYLVENGINQLKSPSTSLCRDGNFKKLLSRSKNDSQTLHVFINFGQFSAQFAPLIQAGKLKAVAGIGSVGEWLLLNFFKKKKKQQLKGFFTAVSGNCLLQANRRCGELSYKNCFSALPDNLASFAWLSIKNYHPPAKEKLWQQFFRPWVDNEIVFGMGEPMEGGQFEQFLLLKAENPKKAEAGMEAFAKSAGELAAYDFQMFRVHQFIGKEVGEIFGVSEAFENPFSTVLGEYVLFSNSKAGLERWLVKYLAGQTFSKSVGFLQSLRSLPPEANGFLYLESGKTWQQLTAFLDERLLASLDGNPLQFSHLAATMQRRGELCEFRVEPSGPVPRDTKPANILWRAPLSAEAAIPPAVFQNPANGELDIFVQDQEMQAYLISRSGRILWRRKLDEPILSGIYQIDLDNNNEGQFVFNTPSKIYVIDRTGADVDGFPLKLQTTATNGVTVVDFFQSHDYWFFIACENGNAYGFDENGSPVEGWRPHENVGIVRHPMLHFQSNRMDFMVLLDEKGRFQVYQKNGEPRFPEKLFEGVFHQPPFFQVHKNSSRIVACDTTGIAYVANLTGEDFRLSFREGSNRNVRFAFTDVAGDERKDYVVLSEENLAVYYYQGAVFKKLFSYQFGNKQDDVFPVRRQQGEKAFIGTVDKDKKQIHLLDGNAQLLPQFPLAGTTSFRIVDLAGDGKAVVVVGNGDSVYAYSLE